MFLETIKIQDGIIHNLDLHQQRLERTQKETFGVSTITISENILIPKAFQKGTVKCRIVYDKDIKEIKYNHYKIRPIQTLKLVNVAIDYTLKYEDRTSINEAYSFRENCDDILMVKDGLLTDTSYANIVIKKNDKLFTPKQPLLRGVKRLQLIEEGVILPKDLTVSDLETADSIFLINAMIELGQVEISTKAVIS